MFKIRFVIKEDQLIGDYYHISYQQQVTSKKSETFYVITSNPLSTLSDYNLTDFQSITILHEN